MKERCPWCGDDPLYRKYHDEEWGVPLHDDQKWFEFLILEGAQAGLSWITILRKRPAYREAFQGFHREKIANYGENDVQRLLGNPGIVRNSRKISSAIQNARAAENIIEEFGSLDAYFRRFTDGEPIQNHFNSMDEIPAETDLSRSMSRDLKQRGMSFVGPTICYAFMQATGMVNDHLVSCYRHKEIMALSK